MPKLQNDWNKRNYDKFYPVILKAENVPVRISNLGYGKNEFIRQAVLEKLEREEAS